MIVKQVDQKVDHAKDRLKASILQHCKQQNDVAMIAIRRETDFKLSDASSLLTVPGIIAGSMKNPDDIA
jgi:hypothetical protein